MRNVGEHEAAANLGIRQHRRIARNKIVTQPEGCPADIVARAVINSGSKSFRDQFQIAPEKAVALPHVIEHVPQLDVAQGIVEGGAIFGTPDGRKQGAGADRRLKLAGAKIILEQKVFRREGIRWQALGPDGREGESESKKKRRETAL